MKSQTNTYARFGQRVYRSGESSGPTSLQDTYPSHPLVSDELRHRVVKLARNPLFLVVVTWLVMAGLLVLEIVVGK